MVFRRRAGKAGKGRKPRRKVARKPRVPRNRLFATSQMAQIKETIQFNNINAATPQDFVFDLSKFMRASQLAVNFKWYRAKFVEWSIEPLFNTFVDDGTPQSVPYMYMSMNRTQDSTAYTLEDLQARGCKPSKLVSKKVIKYRPNWCSPGLLSQQNDAFGNVLRLQQGGLTPQYGYLMCPDIEIPVSGVPITQIPLIASNPTFTSVPVNANQVLYNGHQIWIDQQIPNVNVSVARVTCTVHWEFKDPHCTYLQPASKALEPVTA